MAATGQHHEVESMLRSVHSGSHASAPPSLGTQGTQFRHGVWRRILCLLPAIALLAACGSSELEERLAAENGTLKSELEKLRGDSKDSQAKLGQAQRELTELEAVSAEQAQAAQQKLADAEGARDEVRAEREQLATELAQSQAEMTRVRGALEGEKARLEEALTAVQATLTSRTVPEGRPG